MLRKPSVTIVSLIFQSIIYHKLRSPTLQLPHPLTENFRVLPTHLQTHIIYQTTKHHSLVNRSADVTASHELSCSVISSSY